MPKKFTGENSKAVAARQRKEDIKSEQSKKTKEANEDAAWKDDDKQLLKKQQKKEELEKKKQEQLDKKAQAKALLENEMASIKPVTASVKQPSSKVTRAQISMREQQSKPTTKPEAVLTHIEKPLEENLNKVVIEGELAHSVDEAISILSDTKLDADKHPEKRMKAAYTAFEESNMARIKSENPSLRLSQLKQILHKEWLKSPANPLNN